MEILLHLLMLVKNAIQDLEKVIHYTVTKEECLGCVQKRMGKSSDRIDSQDARQKIRRWKALGWKGSPKN